MWIMKKGYFQFIASKFPLTRFDPFANIPHTTAPYIGAFFVLYMATQSAITSTKKLAFTITLPSVNFKLAISKLKKLTSSLLSNIYNPISSTPATSSDTSRSRRAGFSRMPKMGFKFDKKYFKFLFPIIIVLVVFGVLVSIIRSLPDAKSKPLDSNSQVTAPTALATINLDKKFSFPLKDNNSAVVGNFDYVIQSAQIQKQIIVQGQRATAVNGREFLILNLKITNNLKKTIQLNTRDYIRLAVASDTNEQLAPDIHSDPVEVQAISTKFTRVGIALDEADTKKTIHLKIGEIDGTKQNIDLNFKY